MDLHGYAGKPNEMVRGVHDQLRQKILDTYEAYLLEVKDAQQALHHDHAWVDQRLAKTRGELQKAQTALE